MLNSGSNQQFAIDRLQDCLALRSRSDQIAQHLAWSWLWPLALVVVPRSQDFMNCVNVPGIDECLTNFVAHRVQIRIGDSKFPEDPASMFGIVEFQRLCELELDGVALLGHRWRRNRVSLQQGMALAEDERIADRSASD